jgi:hypothetical protein
VNPLALPEARVCTTAAVALPLPVGLTTMAPPVLFVKTLSLTNSLLAAPGWNRIPLPFGAPEVNSKGAVVAEPRVEPSAPLDQTNVQK